MKRKMFVWLLCLLQIITLCAFPVTDAQAAKVEAPKKIIAVVYDDSGSMEAGNAYDSANYAMQAFAGLLSPRDEMYISYMSDVDKNAGVVTCDMGNIQGTVDQIRTKADWADYTPLLSAQLALEKLESIQESDENAQFWLVILTDGNMHEINTNYKSLQDFLNKNKGKTMSNGTQLCTYYMGIGSAAEEVSADPSKNLNKIMAGDNIVPALSEVANKVSGRIKFDNKDIEQVDSKTVKIHNKLPLYNISVFSQKSRAQVVSVTGDADLHVERNIRLDSPLAALYGNAAVVDNGDKLIQSGDYTVTFSEDISLADTVFMYQLAIEMKPEITKNGVKVKDTSEIEAGDTLDIELIPANPETGDMIDENLLPKGITWGICYSIDGTEIKSSQSRTLTGVKADVGENKITCTMTIPEYTPMVQTITFTIDKPVVYGIQTETFDDDEYDRNNLGLENCKGTPDRYFITADGVPLTKADLDGKKLEVVDVQIDDSMLSGFLDTFGTKLAPVKLKVQDDGSFVLYPGKTVMPAFLLQAGRYQVTVGLKDDNGITAEGSFYVNPQPADWIDLFWLILFLLLIIYIIYITFFKPRFPSKKVIVDGYTAASGGKGAMDPASCKETRLPSWPLSRILPGPTRTKIKGVNLTAYAEKGGLVHFKKDTVEGFTAFGYGSAAKDPANDYKAIIASLDKKDTKKAKEKERKKKASNTPYRIKDKPLYLYNSAVLYRVTLASKTKRRKK